MKHRHLSTRRYTLAAVDDIIENGTLGDWRPLLARVKRDPWGETAERVLRVISEKPASYADPESLALWTAFIERARADRPRSEQTG